MTRPLCHSLAAAVVLVLRLSAMAAPSQWTAAPGGRLWLEGDSTLHRYKSEAQGFSVAVQPSAQTTSAAELLTAVTANQLKDVSFSLNVRALKSGEDGLDKNLWSALNAEHHPTIRFQAASVERLAGTGQSATLRATGRLEVAGVTRPTMLTFIATPSPDGLHVAGAQVLQMSDFGVKPPVLLLGTLKTSDTVTIHFSFTLRPASSQD